MPHRNSRASTVFGRLPLPERAFVADALRTETVGGIVLLGAATVALVRANTPLSSSYEEVRDFHLGIGALGLDLSMAHWTADGLLAIFFFVAGAELKRELVVGKLRDPKTATVPIVAAFSGMAVPALLYGIVAISRGGTWNGWAVPMATDIAFALGVLAVIDTHLPSALRAFLLTLAIVDDLGAIIVIALFYTATINVPALIGAALGPVLFFHLHTRKGVLGWYWYVPLALLIWGLTNASGVHATVAGVAMGLLLRVAKDGEAGHRPAEHIAHLVRPISAGVAVPHAEGRGHGPGAPGRGTGSGSGEGSGRLRPPRNGMTRTRNFCGQAALGRATAPILPEPMNDSPCPRMTRRWLRDHRPGLPVPRPGRIGRAEVPGAHRLVQTASGSVMQETAT